MPAANIDEVIAELTVIVDEAIAAGSRLGYFAALYRKVTMEVKAGIVRGDVFRDNERMERLDVVFANRYLAAHRAYRDGRPCSSCWRLAFDAAASSRLIIIQHLLLGINAHINLDLGAAAAETAPGSEIEGLHHDFDKINEVLAGLVQPALADVNELSPWLSLLDRVGGRTERAIINFSIDVARTEAWTFATELAATGDPQPYIDVKDGRTADLGNLILHPGLLVSGANRIIKAREVKNVPRIIEVLAT